MKKILAILMTTALMSIRSFGQTVPEKLEKLRNDADTKQKAAKADSFIIGRKVILTDTAKTTKITTTKRKKRNCNQTSKNKSGQL
jgi:hypothetical protein